MRYLLKGLFLAGVSILLGYSAAQAHKVTIFAWVEGDRVFTESKFAGGKMVKNGKVEVFDPGGNLLLSGQTDDNGLFSFKIPQNTALNVVLTAGMGHQNAWRLSAAELGTDTQAANATTLPASLPEQTKTQPPSPTGAPGLTAREIEDIVARQLEQKLQPLTRMMVAARDDGPTIGEVFGGIGYIFGLVGLGAYVHYRRENRRS